MAPVTRSTRGRAAAPAVTRALPSVGSIRRLSIEVDVSLNATNGVRAGEETGNAATNNMENENIPEAEEELNDSVQFVDVLNNITGNSEIVDLTTDTETEEDSVASRENLNVALNPVLVDQSGSETSINVPNVSCEVVDLTDSPTPSPAPAPTPSPAPTPPPSPAPPSVE